MTEDTPWTRTTLVAVAAAVLYQALRWANGNYSRVAFAGLVTAIFVLLLAAFVPPIRRLEALGEKGPLAVLGACLALQFVELIGMALRHHAGTSFAHIFFIGGLAICAVVAIAAATGKVPAGNAWFIALVAMHFLLGIAYLRIAEVPQIDVILVQRDSANALLAGRNPYTITYPNIYGDKASFFYGPHIPVINGQVQEGFCYPPLVLYLGLPSYLLTGDVRYSYLAALALSALLLGFSGHGRMSKLAALVFLFSPRSFFLVQSAWTEPFIMLFFSLVLFLAMRNRIPVAALGLLMVAKQYVVFALAVAVFLLLRDRSLRAYSSVMLRAGLVGLVVSLPLILWSVPSFYKNVIETIAHGPFRPDSLSFPAWLVRLGYPPLPSWPAFLALAILSYFLIRKLRPSPASFALSLGLLFLVFFSLSRQAVLNYYSMVAICICGAVAAADASRSAESHNLVESRTSATHV